MLLAADLANGEDIPHEMLVRVRPGTTAIFEEKLVRALQSVAPKWSYAFAVVPDGMPALFC